MSPAKVTQARSSSPRSLDQRLLAYALGGGALALVATPAAATPISSGIQNISVASLGPTANPQATTAVHLDPNDVNSDSFTFGWEWKQSFGSEVFVRGNATAGTAGAFSFYNSGSPSMANNFAMGQSVGAAVASPKYPLYENTGSEAFFSDTDGSWTSGNWAAGGTGYLGFQYLDGSLDPHYGWMQINVPTTSADGQNATLVQWAWESEANTPITIPGGAPVPEIDPASGVSAVALALGGLALLEQQLGFAAGAAGLRAWRKRRQALAA